MSLQQWHLVTEPLHGHAYVPSHIVNYYFLHGAYHSWAAMNHWFRQAHRQLTDNHFFHLRSLPVWSQYWSAVSTFVAYYHLQTQSTCLRSTHYYSSERPVKSWALSFHFSVYVLYTETSPCFHWNWLDDPPNTTSAYDHLSLKLLSPLYIFCYKIGEVGHHSMLQSKLSEQQ